MHYTIELAEGPITPEPKKEKAPLPVEDTSGSQLEDGVDGVIVPMDNEGCAAGIAAVLRDEALRQKLTENTKIRDYTNAGEIEKIYRLLENV